MTIKVVAMIDPKRLIDRVLNDELSVRSDNLERAQFIYNSANAGSPLAEQYREIVKDYRELVKEINEAILLWKKVRRAD